MEKIIKIPRQLSLKDWLKLLSGFIDKSIRIISIDFDENSYFVSLNTDGIRIQVVYFPPLAPLKIGENTFCTGIEVYYTHNSTMKVTIIWQTNFNNRYTLEFNVKRDLSDFDKIWNDIFDREITVNMLLKFEDFRSYLFNYARANKTIVNSVHTFYLFKSMYEQNFPFDKIKKVYDKMHSDKISYIDLLSDDFCRFYTRIFNSISKNSQNVSFRKMKNKLLVSIKLLNDDNTLNQMQVEFLVSLNNVRIINIIFIIENGSNTLTKEYKYIICSFYWLFHILKLNKKYEETFNNIMEQFCLTQF